MSNDQVDINRLKEAYTLGFTTQSLNSGFSDRQTEHLFNCAQAIGNSRTAVAESLLEEADKIRR